MKFSDLDKKMRIYESAHDTCILPEMYIIARIDGRSFTKLTKERHPFEAPFDINFHNYMVETTKHLMNCGFDIKYGFTQSDEISLLFNLNETAFSRKTRKFLSILAGEASAKFSCLLGDVATFDCRLSEFPNSDLVIDYFRWRSEDAHRNALNAHCYWVLRKNGIHKRDATKKIDGLSISEKNELLFSYNINFNDLPSWQKRGTGIYWQETDIDGFNPITQKKTLNKRSFIFVNEELPLKDEYMKLLLNILG